MRNFRLFLQMFKIGLITCMNCYISKDLSAYNHFQARIQSSILTRVDAQFSIPEKIELPHVFQSYETCFFYSIVFLVKKCVRDNNNSYIKISPLLCDKWRFCESHLVCVTVDYTSQCVGLNRNLPFV